MRALRIFVVLALMLAACGGSEGGETTTSSSVPSTTTSTVPSTTTTVPQIDVFREVRSFLVEAIRSEVTAFTDERLAEAGLSAEFTVVVNLDADPVVRFTVDTQEAADAIDEVGSVGMFDHAAVYDLIGGRNVPRLSGDETYASLSLPRVFLTWTDFLDRLGALMTEIGLPSSTVARMEQTRSVDGTLMAEGDGVTASWTYHPDDGLSVIIERVAQEGGR